MWCKMIEFLQMCAQAVRVQQKVKWGGCKSLWPPWCTAASPHRRQTRSLHTSLCLWRPLVVGRLHCERTASSGFSPALWLCPFLLAVTITIPAGRRSCGPTQLLSALRVQRPRSSVCVCLRVKSDVICRTIAHPKWPNWTFVSVCEANQNLKIKSLVYIFGCNFSCNHHYIRWCTFRQKGTFFF